MNEPVAFDYYVEQAQIRHSHRLILLIGRKRFGEPEPKAESELIAIEDLDRLERIFVAALDAASWQELLATQ